MDPRIQAYAGGSSLIRHHLSEDFDTFWALMQNIRELAVQQKIASVNDRPSKRRTVFSSRGLFFLVIQLLPVTTSGIQDRRHAYCQLDVLCFIHAILLQLQDSTRETENFLIVLEQRFADVLHEQDEFPAYPLLWLLQRAPD